MPKEYKSINRHGMPGASPPRAHLRGLNFAAAERISLKGWLIFAAAALALAILAYVGLWFYQGNLFKQTADLNKKNEEMLARLDKQAVKKLVDAKTNSEIISGLLQNHKLTSRLIDALAASTLPKVRWLSLAAALDKNSLALTGKAASYAVLAKQLTALKEESDWRNIEVSNIALGKDGYVGFSLNLDFETKAAQ